MGRHSMCVLLLSTVSALLLLTTNALAQPAQHRYRSHHHARKEAYESAHKSSPHTREADVLGTGNEMGPILTGGVVTGLVVAFTFAALLALLVLWEVAWVLIAWRRERLALSAEEKGLDGGAREEETSPGNIEAERTPTADKEAVANGDSHSDASLRTPAAA